MMGIKRDFIGMFDVMKGILMLMVLMIHHIAFNQAVLRYCIIDYIDFCSGITSLCLAGELAVLRKKRKNHKKCLQNTRRRGIIAHVDYGRSNGA